MHVCRYIIYITPISHRRGRLNILANVMRKSLIAIMAELQPYLPDEPEFPNNADDVRYHLGTTQRLFYAHDMHNSVNLVNGTAADSNTSGGDSIGNNANANTKVDVLDVSLAANPSHLEAVNSVVLGKARARQLATDVMHDHTRGPDPHSMDDCTPSR